jgi:hypothetical protein
LRTVHERAARCRHWWYGHAKWQTAANTPVHAVEHKIPAPLIMDAMAAANLPKESIDGIVPALPL